jgi:hypothetical protein
VVECAFGIVCNKWRIFHRAVDVCLDFCNVTVKTYCILHSFICQRDSIQLQDTLYECSLESIKAVGNRGNITGTDMGRSNRDGNVSLLGSLAGGLCVEEDYGEGHLCL